MTSKHPFLFLLAFSVLAPAVSARADNVYKWQDKQGVVHYSNKAPTADAKPLELPDITRADYKLPVKPAQSCEQHGGVNCQAGADADGSIICADGFKDAPAPFRFSCSSPKLQVDDVSELTEAGGFSVFVRNTKGVIAVAPLVSFKSREGEVALEGPKEIDAFGSAEFVFKPETGLKIGRKPSKAEVKISCSNCS